MFIYLYIIRNKCENIFNVRARVTLEITITVCHSYSSLILERKSRVRKTSELKRISSLYLVGVSIYTPLQYRIRLEIRFQRFKVRDTIGHSGLRQRCCKFADMKLFFWYCLIQHRHNKEYDYDYIENNYMHKDNRRSTTNVIIYFDITMKYI